MPPKGRTTRRQSQPRSLGGTRQRLGRRLGREPYYTVAERTADRLRLVSRPALNRVAALRLLVGGGGLVVVALVVAVSGLISAATGAGFAVASLAAVVAGLFGLLGYQRVVGGYAILTTYNRILCDREAATITFHQGSNVGVERTQVLAFNQISELRLQRQALATGWPLPQVRPIIALELGVGAERWVVDSATDPEALRPTAEALSALLQRAFARET